MIILNDILLDFIAILGKAYPRINIVGLNTPGSYLPEDFIVLERFGVSRTNIDLVSEILLAEESQAVMNYMGGNIYMSAKLNTLGGGDLKQVPITYNIIEHIQKGASKIVDTDADIVNNMYLYRIIYKSYSDVGSTSYILGAEIPTIDIDAEPDPSVIAEEKDSYYSFISGSGTMYRIGKGKGALYRFSSGGIIVEKGTPMVHAAQRYNGPIERSKEIARFNAMLGAEEYMENSLDNVTGIIKSFFKNMNTMNIDIIERM